MLCASSPTTSTFPCGAAVASTISPCSRLVSWYSSTSTAEKRRQMLSRAAGTSTSSRFQFRSRSSKSIAFICALRSAKRRATRRISSSSATNCGASVAITSASGRCVFTAVEYRSISASGRGNRRCPTPYPRSAVALAITSFASSRSRSPKRSAYPSREACSRRSPCATWWNVPPHILRVSTRQSWPTRAIISRAALLVNVSSRMLEGGVPVSSRCATRYVSARVLPEPAPAITSVGRASQSATARCSSERSRS